MNRSPRSLRPAARTRLVFGIATLVILVVGLRAFIVDSALLDDEWGMDRRLYLDAARRWFEGGWFYPPEQLAGPFADDGKRILYPPTAILLFVPFAYLPEILWWTIPGAIVAWQVWRLRPAPLIWPFLAICAAWRPTYLTIVLGNPVIWFGALFALATVYAWPAVLVLVKPSMAPFALWGITRRSWWLAGLGAAVVSLPFGALWVEWVQVMLNSRVGGLLHSTLQFGLLVFPLLVWVGRSDGGLARWWASGRVREVRQRAMKQETA
jgi:hypothetical protein